MLIRINFFLISPVPQPSKFPAARKAGSGQGLQNIVARISRGSIAAKRKRRLNRYCASPKYRRAYLACLIA